MKHLESLIALRPSTLHFQAICSLVDNWHDSDTLDTAILLAAQGLVSWPNEVRVADCNGRSITAFASAKSWPLFRAIEATSVSDLLSVTRPHTLHRITHLSIRLDHSDTYPRFDLAQLFPDLRYLLLDGIYDCGVDTLKTFVLDRLPSTIDTLVIVHFPAPAWTEFARFLAERKLLSLTSLQCVGEPADFICSIASELPTTLQAMRFRYVKGAINAIDTNTLLATSLRSLDLTLSRKGHGGVAELAQCNTISGLESLVLADCDLRPVDIAALGEAKVSHNLRRLVLRANYFGDEGGAALSRCPFRTVAYLDIAQNGLSDKAAVGLAGSSLLSTSDLIQYLDVSHNDIGDSGFLSLVRAPGMCSIQTLLSERNAITDKGVVAFVGTGHLQHLKTLRIGWNKLGEDSVEAIAEANDLCEIQELGLEDACTSVKAIDICGKSATFGQLTNLSLGWKRFGDAEAIAFRRNAKAWPRLRSLEFVDTCIGNDGVAALADTESLEVLCRLKIESRRELGAAALQSLCRSPFVHHLVELEMYPLVCETQDVINLGNSELGQWLSEVNIGVEYDRMLVRCPMIRPVLRSLLEQRIQEDAQGE